MRGSPSNIKGQQQCIYKLSCGNTYKRYQHSKSFLLFACLKTLFVLSPLCRTAKLPSLSTFRPLHPALFPLFLSTETLFPPYFPTLFLSIQTIFMYTRERIVYFISEFPISEEENISKIKAHSLITLLVAAPASLYVWLFGRIPFFSQWG